MSSPGWHKLVLAGLFLGSAVAGRLEAQTGVLFPQSFVVEHHLVQTDGDGSVFHGETVTDHYGGSWIVSLRPDDSRMVIDLARGELTEISPAAGTYWSLSYDRFAELRDALAVVELRTAAEPPADREVALKNAGPPAFEITEPRAGAPKATDETQTLDERASRLLAASTVRHLRVMPKDAGPDAAALDVWADARVRLAPAARAALVRLEQRVLSPAPAAAKAGAVAVNWYLAAVRDHVDGAFLVRTVRPLAVIGSQPRGTMEDIATRLEPLASFPTELVEVPEGLRRVVHPMEAALAFARQEAELKALMGDPKADPR